MGGRDNVLAAAREAIAAGDDQWAAELATWLIKIDLGDREARALKANAMRRWGHRQKNANWRNWALTTALELEDRLAPPRGMAFGGPDSIRNIPTKALIRLMTVRLKAEEAMNDRCTVGFRVTDAEEACALEIRRGVCEFHDGIPGSPDLILKMDRTTLYAVFLRQLTFAQGVESGRIAIDGSLEKLCTFLDRFEETSMEMPIAVR
jgi:alkyl sulfatase BDS1-like metallo-beta-lactamase superfamily hydrolase